MASRVFQSMVVQMKEATTRMIGVVDTEGNVIASSDLNLMGAHIVESFELAAILSEKTAAIGGRTYKTLGSSDVNFDYAVFVEGTDEIASSFAVMAAIAVSSAKTYYEEKYDRSALVKNIITENILPGDIYVHAKELHFVSDAPRGVFYVRQLGKSEVGAVECLRRLFPDRQKDFVISINEADVAVIKEMSGTVEEKDLIKLAANMEKVCRTPSQGACQQVQGSPDRHRGRQGFRYRKERYQLREPRHRQTYLSAPYHDVRNVPLRSV